MTGSGTAPSLKPLTFNIDSVRIVLADGSAHQAVQPIVTDANADVDVESSTPLNDDIFYQRLVEHRDPSESFYRSYSKNVKEDELYPFRQYSKNWHQSSSYPSPEEADTLLQLIEQSIHATNDTFLSRRSRFLPLLTTER